MLFAAVVMAVAFISCGDEETEPLLKIGETELTVDSDGGTLLVGVASNVSWNVASDANWCFVVNCSGNGDGDVIVKVAANPYPLDREARLTVYGGSLKAEAVVRQPGFEPGNNEESPNGSGNVNGEGNKPSGKLPGRFSVSSTKQVCFSMGNLQYQASTKTWRFAENQYDAIGADNGNVSSSYSGWIDLFGWGTSGYDGKYPYNTSASTSDYGSDGIAGTNYDWGVYNAISNGGGKAGMWRTLTKDEWNYLLYSRAKAKKFQGQATVNGQTGYILLPDGWSAPSGLTFTANPDDFTTNSYSATEWREMESAGAVFLPCAGIRDGSTIYNADSIGYYWSSTYINSYVVEFSFSSRYSDICDGRGYSGNSVRLVQDCGR